MSNKLYKTSILGSGVGAWDAMPPITKTFLKRRGRGNTFQHILWGNITKDFIPTTGKKYTENYRLISFLKTDIKFFLFWDEVRDSPMVLRIWRLISGILARKCEPDAGPSNEIVPTLAPRFKILFSFSRGVFLGSALETQWFVANQAGCSIWGTEDEMLGITKVTLIVPGASRLVCIWRCLETHVVPRIETALYYLQPSKILN